MKLIDSKTYENLARSYAGECQARVRYEFIEYGARNEGYKQLAELIDKVVYNEFNHARMLYTKIQDASEKPIKNIEKRSKIRAFDNNSFQFMLFSKLKGAESLRIQQN